MSYVPAPPLANPLAFRTAHTDLWTPSECQQILDGLRPEAWETVQMEREDAIVRDVTVQPPNFAEAADLLNRLFVAACQINEQYFRFDLSGIWDSDQPTVVRYEPGHGHYGWHADCAEPSPRRKLSFSVLLSDPADYEGGDLEVRGFDPAPRVRGTLFTFPSFMLHQVTPVTTGSRSVLVGWVHGPTFR